MRAERQKTNHVGVYKRTYPNKRDPKDGKPDICYEITYKANGKKIWKMIGWKSEGHTPISVYNKRIKILHELRTGEKAPIDRKITNKNNFMTVDAAWKYYRENWLNNHVKDAEHENGRYTNHIKPYIGHLALDATDKSCLEEIKLELNKKGLSAASIQHVIANISRLYNYLINSNHFKGYNPAKNYKKSFSKLDNARKRFLTPEEAKSILAVLKNRSQFSWELASISLATGMRLGEILALRMNDVNFEQKYIQILDAKAGSRYTYFNDADEIEQILRNKYIPNSDALFYPDQEGNVRKSQNCNRTFKVAVDFLGLNDGIKDRRNRVVFHTLRHTFASWLAIKGVPLYHIAKLLGHSTLEMTQRYAHLCPSTLQGMQQNIQQILNDGDLNIS